MTKNIDEPITLCGHGGGKAEGNWMIQVAEFIYKYQIIFNT